MGHDSIFLSGPWAEKTAVGEFLDLINTGIRSSSAFQLVQTYAECSLERFNPEYSPDRDKLEQYRAFGADWELWVRSMDSSGLRFRLIMKQSLAGADARTSLEHRGYRLDPSTSVEDAGTVKASYPLWGKPLFEGKTHPGGWYTERIPQIIKYPSGPAVTRSERVWLTVENFIRSDGSVELVRYTGLEVKEAI